MTRYLALDRTLRAAACLGAILAAGCGGGGDGGGSPPPPELLQITAGNQVAVARATAANFVSLGSVNDVGIVGSSGAQRGSAVAGAAKHALGKAMAVARSGGSLRPLATHTDTEDCPAGGSISITIDDRDNSGTASAGDVLTMAFTDCRYSASSLIKGGVTASLATVSDTQMTGLFTFSQLTLVEGSESVSANGQANATYSEATDAAGTMTARTTISVTAAGLVTSISTPGYSDTFTNDPDFSAVWTDVMPRNAPGYSTSALVGRVHIASLNGKIILATDPPVHVWSAEQYPDSGVILATGYQSKLRLTAVNTQTARLELDANNDGAFESTRDIAWNELLPY
jgi:hypothetical protein